MLENIGNYVINLLNSLKNIRFPKPKSKTRNPVPASGELLPLRRVAENPAAYAPIEQKYIAKQRNRNIEIDVNKNLEKGLQQQLRIEYFDQPNELSNFFNKKILQDLVKDKTEIIITSTLTSTEFKSLIDIANKFDYSVYSSPFGYRLVKRR